MVIRIILPDTAMHGPNLPEKAFIKEWSNSKLQRLQHLDNWSYEKCTILLGSFGTPSLTVSYSFKLKCLQFIMQVFCQNFEVLTPKNMISSSVIFSYLFLHDEWNSTETFLDGNDYHIANQSVGHV